MKGIMERDETVRETHKYPDLISGIRRVGESGKEFVAFDGDKESVRYRQERWARRWLMKRLARMGDQPSAGFEQC